MTYFGYLLRFVLIPILILLAITWRDKRQGNPISDLRKKTVWFAISIIALMAVIYTTPWDNYLVASGVWFYDPRLIAGVILGWVPLEEYIFFVAETILCGLWWLYLAQRLPAPAAFQPSRSTRFLAVGVLLAVWLISVVLFFSSWKEGTYLTIILAWALPALLPQFLFGADILWHHRKLLFWAIIPAGLYLSMTDIIALRGGIWSISTDHTTGIGFFGILPLEEVLFFFITSVMIACGLTLALSNLGRARLSDWKQRNYRGLP